MTQTDTTLLNKPVSRGILRGAVGAMFFMAGLCFASWASRIATIQQKLNLSDAALGAVLFAVPVGLMLSLPFSGWAVARIGSRRLLLAALFTYGISLIGLGADNSVPLLVANLVLFGFASNAVNISVNTQAVITESFYDRPIMASFHGLWSMAGFVGAGVGTFMIGKGIVPFQHFVIIAIIIIIGIAVCAGRLDPDKGPRQSGPIFVLPDRSLIKLGLIAFCSMICEGAMFDWSVIYFRKIILAQNAWMGAGYTAFMCTMATGRFIADSFAHRYGLRRTLQVSGCLTAIGLLIAVLFPYLITAIGGFLLVGFGVSSVVPLVYSAAGRSKTMSPGVAIAAVSTISFVGFLIGPPVIGFIAGALSLRASFTLIAVMGASVAMLSTFSKGLDQH